MIILLAVLGIGLVATPIVLENMEPAPVASNIVNKPTVNYSPAPAPVEDIKAVNEKVGKLVVNELKNFLKASYELYKDRLTKECAKSKLEILLASENITINTIRAITKDKPKEFDTLIKNLEWEYNLYKDNTDLLYDVILGKYRPPVNPYILPNHHVIYTEAVPGYKDVTYVVFNDGEMDIKGLKVVSPPPPEMRRLSDIEQPDFNSEFVDYINGIETVKDVNGKTIVRRIGETVADKKLRQDMSTQLLRNFKKMSDLADQFGSWVESKYKK